VDGPAAGRVRRARDRRRPPRGVPPDGGLRPVLRRRRAGDRALGGRPALPAGPRGRRARRHLRAGRRPRRPRRRRDGAREGNLAVLEDPGSYGYYREETGGLLVGLFEPVAAPWRLDGIPADFSFGTLPPDWERVTPFLERAMGRIPGSFDGGVRTFFCGPESF